MKHRIQLRAEKVVSTAMRWHYWRTTKGDPAVKDGQAAKILANLSKACRRLQVERERGDK